MKNYSDLRAINTKLDIVMELEPVGSVNCRFGIDEILVDYELDQTLELDWQIDVDSSFVFQIELTGKSTDSDGLLIKRLSVDGIDLVPKFTHLAQCTLGTPTQFLGQLSKWTLTIDRPFYQWLHGATAQGWLFG
jgi:hypothetical protein